MDELVRVDTAKGRYYKLGNKKLPSVTTVISIINKPQLIPWAAKVEREMVLGLSSKVLDRVVREEGIEELPGTNLNIGTEGWYNFLDELLGKEKAHQKLKEKAGDIGTQAHARVQYTLLQELGKEKGPPPELNEEALRAFQAWETWRFPLELKPVAVEESLYSTVYGCAGTMDLLARLNGPVTANDYFTGENVTIECDNTLAVIDWKSGKAVYPESFLQNAIYRAMVRERELGDPELGLIVRLPKTASDPYFEVVWCPPEDECIPVFLAAKRLFEWEKKYHKYPKKEKKSKEDLE